MMRLRSLEVSDFRKFDRPVRLEGLTDGINVLAEPNEFGKSTLLAAIKTVLFEKHRARGKVGERMQHHRNATSPVLSLGFELADGLHHIEKRFMHREPYARLTLPDGTRLEGDVAEERLQTLLGFGPAGKQGATPDSIGLWGALWVAQQEAVQQPALPESGRATLHACLEAELGTMAGSDRSGALSGQVRAELFKIIDGFGKPKGRFKEVGDQLVSAETLIGQLIGKRTAFKGTINELARLRRELAQASDAVEDTKLAADLVDTRGRRDAALRHKDLLRGTVSDLSLADRRHADAVAETARRTSRREEIARLEAAIAGAMAKEAGLLEEQDAAEALLAEKRDKLDQAELAAGGMARNLRTANEVASLVMRSDQVLRLSGQLERAGAAQAEVSRMTGALSAQLATVTRLQAVTVASVTLARTRSVLDALATEVEFDLEPAAGRRVEVAGDVLPPGRTTLRMVGDTAITIAGVGRVWVRPAIRDRQVLLEAVDAAGAELDDALAALGAASPAEAAIKATARSELVRDLGLAEAALKAETPGDKASGLKPGLEALRDYVEEGRSQLTAELKALTLEMLPDAAEAHARLNAANEAADAATETVASARIALAGPEAEHVRAAAERSAAVLAAGSTRAELTRLRFEEDAALATKTEADLVRELRGAATFLVAQQTLVAQMQRDTPADTVEDMDVRIKRLEEAGLQRLTTVRRLRESIAGVAERVAHDEAEGLDEQLAELEGRRDGLAGEQATLQREVKVLTLLRDTLAAAEREARERYVAPVLNRVTPYLQGLFPGVAVGLDDALQITELTRQAGPEAFDRLSDGTVEQVAVLLRLAYADLLLEQGKPAMLILDDALAYSDRDRLELIFDVLTQAAVRMQVLVLTCRADAFSRLGGNRVTLVGR